MSKLGQIKNKIKGIPQAIEDGFFIALKSQTLLLEERNRDTLEVGDRTDGTLIKPPYRPYTVQEKKRKGQPFDRVTLRDTGSFWRSIRYQIRGNELEAKALDPKFEQLNAKYSTAQGKIVGISKDTQNELLRFSPLLKFTLFEAKRITNNK